MSVKTAINNDLSNSRFEVPRLEFGKAMLIAGLRSRYLDSMMDTISQQWLRFMPYIGNVAEQVGQAAYGLNFLGTGAPFIEYLTGVEVSSCKGLPQEFSCVRIPAQKYGVFAHSGHVSKVYETCEAIGTKWLPESGYQPAPRTQGAPDFFERYSREFNPQTGIGGIEIWVPIK